MRLYTCVDGHSLYNNNEIFGAWDDSERSEYDEFEDIIYVFEVDSSDLISQEGNYSYYIRAGATLTNLDSIHLK